MAWTNARGPLVHLGSLHGSGALWVADGTSALGIVSYEIDAYRQRGIVSANGRIEGDTALLGDAFAAGADRIVFDDGTVVAVALSDPEGETEAEIRLRAPWPDFAPRLARRA